MIEVHGEEKGQVEGEIIYALADTDGNGQIDFFEFKSAMVQKEMFL